MALLLSTHHPDHALYLADRAVLLGRGGARTGAAADLLTDTAFRLSTGFRSGRSPIPTAALPAAPSSCLTEAAGKKKPDRRPDALSLFAPKPKRSLTSCGPNPDAPHLQLIPKKVRERSRKTAESERAFGKDRRK